MLERTAGCLEQGSLRCLLPASKRSFKSKRMLHSAFWDHGASELDISPLIQALVRAPEATGDPDRPVRPVLASSSGQLLDFLYPSSALKFLRQCTLWHFERHEHRHSKVEFGRVGQRLYSSIAIAEKEAAKTPRISEENVATESSSQSISNSMVKSDELDKSLLNDSTNPGITWEDFQSRSYADQADLIPRLLQFMARSTEAVDARRAISLFARLEGAASEEALQAVLRSYIMVGDTSKAMEVQLRLIQKFGTANGSDVLFAHTVATGDWQNALQLWKVFSSFRASKTDIDVNLWRHVEQLPNLQDQALAMAADVNYYVAKASRDIWDTSIVTRTSADMLSLASRIVYRALSSTGQHSNSKKFLRLLKSLQKWNLDTAPRYEQLIYRLLEAKRRHLALECYLHYRSKVDMQPNTDLLIRLLRASCSLCSVQNINQIMQDWREMHGVPPQQAFRMCLAAFASIGDTATVHQLWSEYTSPANADKMPINSHDIVPLMHAHAKCGEISEVRKIFNEMEITYGFKPSLRNWNSLINAYGKVGETDEAFATFNSLLETEIKPDAYTFGTLMGICIKRGDLPQAMDVYQLAESLGVQRSPAMIDAIVLGYVREDKLSQAEKICEDAIIMDSDKSKPRMWNFLITAYAMKRDLENANRILRRMKELDIQYDGDTYAALMQALSMVKQPERAWSILRKVLPEAGVQITSFHYAIVMGGFLATRQLSRVFQVDAIMKRNNITESSSTRLLKIKTSALQDQDPSNLSINGETREVQLVAADRLFQEAMNNSQAQHFNLARKKGFGAEALDVQISTAYFDFMLFVYGRNGSDMRVKQLQELLKAKLPARSKDTLPAKVLSALMASNLQNRDYEGVLQCWEKAFNQAKKLSQPISTETSLRVLPSHKFDLAVPLSYLIQALSRQSKFDQLADILGDVQNVGFELDSKNWNIYVQALTRANKFKTAFELCEAKLMPGWTGWARVRWRLPVRNRLSVQLRNAKKDSRYLRPIYHTLLYLARALMDLKASSTESKTARFVLDDLMRRCPKTVSAVTTMIANRDELEMNVMRR